MDSTKTSGHHTVMSRISVEGGASVEIAKVLGEVVVGRVSISPERNA